MIKLLYNNDELVAQWVANKIPHMHGQGFGPATAIGIVDGKRLIAGVVFSDYQEKYSTLMLSMAALSPKWAQRWVIRSLLAYPFEQLGVNKLWTTTPMKNERALKFNYGIGFVREGILSKHFGDDHAVVCRMFRKDYLKRWAEADGQEVTKSTRSA